MMRACSLSIVRGRPGGRGASSGLGTNAMVIRKGSSAGDDVGEVGFKEGIVIRSILQGASCYRGYREPKAQNQPHSSETRDCAIRHQMQRI